MHIHKFFTAPTAKTFSAQMVFWFSLSLTFAVMYSLLGLQQAFSSEYVVQDDARQHVFWMRRFLDPDLFPNDLLADYFQSVAPWGYTNFYRLFALVGVDPVLLSKFLPIGLSVITTGYCFGVCLQMLPVPMAGFLSSLLLNQYLWLRDDIVSGTPVAFVYPLFVAFLYYLLCRRLLFMCVAIALLGLFYPQCVLICAGILVLQLLRWQGGRPRLQDRSNCLFCGVGLGVALVVIFLYALKSSNYGPVITAVEAKSLLEFGPRGLSKFFVNIPGDYWFTGQRSGILPKFGTIVPIIAALLLPLLLLFPSLLPLLKRVTGQVRLLGQITLASLGMFFIAHALLFKLHLPSRYTEHSLRVVTALAGGIALTIILDAVLLWAKPRGERAKDKTLPERQRLALVVTTLLLSTLVLNPVFLKQFPKTEYAVGQVPALYKFFAQQPKDILIASLAEKEVTNLPTFAQRSILVGGVGFPVPYHQGYYAQIRQRTVDLINAQYSSDLNQIKSFIQKYGIDFWLLEKSAFTPMYITQSRWISQYQPAASEAIAHLEQGTPALASVTKRCAVFETGGFVVLRTKCIVNGRI